MSSFLFTGSTGVGKTELSKQLAELLFGTGAGMVQDSQYGQEVQVETCYRRLYLLVKQSCRSSLRNFCLTMTGPLSVLT